MVASPALCVSLTEFAGKRPVDILRCSLLFALQTGMQGSARICSPRSGQNWFRHGPTNPLSGAFIHYTPRSKNRGNSNISSFRHISLRERFGSALQPSDGMLLVVIILKRCWRHHLRLRKKLSPGLYTIQQEFVTMDRGISGENCVSNWHATLGSKPARNIWPRRPSSDLPSRCFAACNIHLHTWTSF